MPLPTLQPPTAMAPDCDCASDPISDLTKMFVHQVQFGRIAMGQEPARRPVFLRLHGVAHGEVRVRPDLPRDLRVGLFGGPDRYPAWVRFSSDIPDGRPDLKSTVGAAVKLFSVPGVKALAPDEGAPTADILFQNFPVFFVDDAAAMCAFTKASLTSPEAAAAWLRDHAGTARILAEMQQVVPSVLASAFWSVIPFHFGPDRYCKYKLEPEVVPPGPDPDYADPDYLRADLHARLRGGEARFRILVQLQSDPDAMPLDRATVPWDEALSPPIHVATLLLPQQDTAARGQAEYGETLAFNPWRTPTANAPVGSLAEARGVVYQASAALRRNVNGQPLGEPSEVRPPTVWPQPRDDRIVRAAIHPGIGVARIGNSTAEDGFFIGPEVVDPPPTPPGGYRDAAGAIRRQAARFRIYGYNAAGEVVGELGADDADVRWTVHLANRKAQWYQFEAALDLPEAAKMALARRNPRVAGADRETLAIDPGPRTIVGKGQAGPDYQFNTGTFQGTAVPLGELRTDDRGRLLVLGGLGVSASPDGTPIFDPARPASFNNADGWYDDIADGPVTATVSIQGRDVPVEPSWVVVAPPDYAPGVVGWRTLYDLLTDTYVACGWLPFPSEASFTRDVLPALHRLSNLQWVNKGFASMFGRGGPLDFEDAELIAKLARRPDANGQDPYGELRQVVYNAFRSPTSAGAERGAWPWIYGDAFGSFPGPAGQNLPLSTVRAQMLRRWVEGDFLDDWEPSVRPPRTIAEVPLPQRPAMLDQAALHFCLADAFHPGCEMTWPMRHATMYASPFRIRRAPPDEPEPDYGAKLTQQIALAPGGPLYAQRPGDITRWMALPWQGDTAFCRSGYDPTYDPYLPTFWPARVPNQVLTADDYAVVMNTELPREQRIAAFQNRPSWLRALHGSAPEQMLQMVAHFGRMGLIEARPGLRGDPDFPPVMLVESLPPQAAGLALKAAAPGRQSRIQRAGWDSPEQLAEFRAIRVRG